MSRRWWLLNVLLLALTIAGMLRIRDNFREAQTRRAALLGQPVPQVPAPLVPVAPAAPPATGAQYVEVANQMLLSKDRNPNVVVDVVAPKLPPPFPRFYGVMDFGTGPSVILVEKPGAKQKSYRLGEQVGEFKLLSINRQVAEFEWEGKKLTAKLSELRDTQPVVEAPPPAAAAAPAASQSKSIVVGGADLQKPGAEVGVQTKGCQPGDTSPAGSVVDGYRKVVSQTPFGNACRWEKVN